MSDLSRVLGLDSHPAALSALNSVGQSLAVSAGQAALDRSHLPINLAQFVPTVPATDESLPTSLSPQDWAQRINGIKVVLHALIEGVNVNGKTAQQFITDVETQLDAWVDSNE